MCQAAPLPRCSHHADVKLKELDQELVELSHKKLAVSEKVVELKRQARKDGYTDKQIMDQKTAGLEELNKSRREYDQLERDTQITVRDSWEQELHKDATPTGRKALENDENSALRGFRLKNAKKLNAWHKSVRQATDSDGIPFTSKDSDPEERYTFYGKEFAKARQEYKDATSYGEELQNRMEKVNAELDTYETSMVGRNDPQGRKPFSRVAKHPEDAEEVEYLERQKASVIAGVHTSHHEQVLARAKMGRLHSAIKVEKERRKKEQTVQNKENLAKLKEHRGYLKHRTPELREELKKDRMTLADMAKRKSNSSDNDNVRLSAKSAAVETSLQLLDKYQDSHRGAPEQGYVAMRKELNDKRLECIAEADNSKNDVDRAIWAGAQGGYSLVLDKIKSL